MLTQHKCFSFGKALENLFFLKQPYGIWSDSSPFKISSCHDLSGNPLPKAISPLCVKINFKSSKLNSPMILSPFISNQKPFLPSILTLGDLQRNYHFSFEFCLQTNFPGQSLEPSTKIHEDPLVSSSKFSNYTCCKFGPDLSNLMKFIQILLQKF